MLSRSQQSFNENKVDMSIMETTKRCKNMSDKSDRIEIKTMKCINIYSDYFMLNRSNKIKKLYIHSSYMYVKD